MENDETREVLQTPKCSQWLFVLRAVTVISLKVCFCFYIFSKISAAYYKNFMSQNINKWYEIENFKYGWKELKTVIKTLSINETPELDIFTYFMQTFREQIILRHLGGSVG